MPAAAQAQKARAAAAKPAAAGAKEEPEAESVRNLAYVVNSANDNIVTLQRTVTAQEKELAEKAEAASALQRNYETLSRIRQADQREFMALKRLHEAQQDELKALQESVAAQTERSTQLEQQVADGAAAQSERLQLQLRVSELEREAKERATDTAQVRKNAAELVESNRALKMSVEKMTRAQHELMQRSRKADDGMRALQAEKETAEKAHAAAAAKLVVAERQLKTFLEANEAMEGDLRTQASRVAQLERRKQESEAERQTVEAYYEARLEEMQTQYNRLLADIDSAKQSAKDEVFRNYSLGDNDPVVPNQSSPSQPNNVHAEAAASPAKASLSRVAVRSSTCARPRAAGPTGRTRGCGWATRGASSRSAERRQRWLRPAASNVHLPRGCMPQ